MANSIIGDVHKATIWSIALSIMMIAAGVLAICIPAIAGIAITALVGWLLIFSGLLHLAFAWRGDRAGAVLWEVLLGVLYGVIGFYLLASPIGGLRSLTLAIAMYLLDRRRSGIHPVGTTSSGAGHRLAPGRRHRHIDSRSDDLEHLAVKRPVGRGYIGWHQHVLQRYHATDALVDGATDDCVIRCSPFSLK